MGREIIYGMNNAWLTDFLPAYLPYYITYYFASALGTWLVVSLSWALLVLSAFLVHEHISLF